MIFFQCGLSVNNQGGFNATFTSTKWKNRDTSCSAKGRWRAWKLNLKKRMIPITEAIMVASPAHFITSSAVLRAINAAVSRWSCWIAANRAKRSLKLRGVRRTACCIWCHCYCSFAHAGQSVYNKMRNRWGGTAVRRYTMCICSPFNCLTKKSMEIKLALPILWAM